MIADLTFQAKLEQKSGLDGSPPHVPTLGSELHKTKNVIKAIYDFSVSGGAVGDVPLFDDLGRRAYLPSGAIITRSFLHVATAVTTSAAGTLGLTAESASDVVAQQAAAALTLNALVEGVQDGTAAAMVRLTAQRQLTAKIVTGALTSGKVYFFVEYVITG